MFDINTIIKYIQNFNFKDINNKELDTYKQFILLLYNSAYFELKSLKTFILEIDKNYNLTKIYNFISNNIVCVIPTPAIRLYYLNDNNNISYIDKYVTEQRITFEELQKTKKNKTIIIYQLLNSGIIRYFIIENEFLHFNKKILKNKIRKLKLNKLNEFQN